MQAAPNRPTRVLSFYKRWLSPLLGARCRFVPSCSEYATEAWQRFGLLRGVWLALSRFVRCQPCACAGYDPVPQRMAWFGSRPQQPRTDDPSTQAKASEAPPLERPPH